MATPPLYYPNLGQDLPTEIEMKLFKEAMAMVGYKMIYIEETNWHNALTKTRQTVTHIPIYAYGNNSNRTRAIKSIKFFHHIKDSTQRIFNYRYYHTNISDSDSEDWIDIFHADQSKKEELADKLGIELKDLPTKIRISYQEICSPITNYSLFTKDEKTITLIFKGQLTGQNANSPFQHVNSVANTYCDFPLKEIGNGRFIKRSAPIVQLLSKSSLDNLRNEDTLRNTIRSYHLEENQVYAKHVDNSDYTLMSKEEYENYKERKKISAYYPVIEPEQMQELEKNLPKSEYDMTVFGLGSAGTGILDQVAHFTTINKYFLADFDLVEEKNLRNQWYSRNQIGRSKVYSSGCNMFYLKPQWRATTIPNPRNNQVQYHPYMALACMPFQNCPLQFMKTKYVVSGFDSIDTRLELLEKIEKKELEAKYLIDLRYNDLEADIYFMDTENEEQMAYYKKGLLSDKKILDDMRPSEEEIQEKFLAHLDKKRVFDCNCSDFLYVFKDFLASKSETYSGELPYNSNACNSGGCKNDECKAAWLAFLKDNKKRLIEHCKLIEQQESSCVKHNLIDIYKFASSFVFSAIREIEDNNNKTFTHIEVTTAEGMPRYLVRRK